MGSSARMRPRAGGERPADRHALLLAAGELLGVAVEEGGEAEAVGELGLPGGVEAAGEAGLEGEVGRDVEARDQVELLEDEADGVGGGARRGRRRRGAVTSACRRPRCVPASTASRPATRWRSVLLPLPELAGEGEAAAGGEGERDAAEHRERALGGRVGLGDVDEAQDGLGHPPPSSAPAGSARPRPVGNTWR